MNNATYHLIMSTNRYADYVIIAAWLHCENGEIKDGKYRFRSEAIL